MNFLFEDFCSKFKQIHTKLRICLVKALYLLEMKTGTWKRKLSNLKMRTTCNNILALNYVKVSGLLWPRLWMFTSRSFNNTLELSYALDLLVISCLSKTKKNLL